MSKGDNSPGMSKLAGVLKGIAHGAQDTSLVLDFGVIQPNGSLLTNTYPIPIPKADYLVCRGLRRQSGSFTTSEAEADNHKHTGSVQTSPAVKAGDRVLVAWVQNDAVVVDVIVAASAVV